MISSRASSCFPIPLGPVMVGCGGILFGLQNILTKISYEDLNPPQAQLLIRSSALLFVLFSILCGKSPLHPNRDLRQILFLSFLMACGSTCMDFAIYFAPAENCAILMSMLPFFTAIISPWNSIRWRILFSSLMVCIIGIALILKPEYRSLKTEQCLAYLLVSVGNVFCAIYILHQRKVSVDSRALCVGTVSSRCVLYGLVQLFQPWRDMTKFDLMTVLSCGAALGLATVLSNEGYTCSCAIAAAFLLNLQCPSTFIFEVLLIGKAMDLYSLIGLLLVLIAISFYITYGTKPNDTNEVPGEMSPLIQTIQTRAYA